MQMAPQAIDFYYSVLGLICDRPWKKISVDIVNHQIPGYSTLINISSWYPPNVTLRSRINKIIFYSWQSSGTVPIKCIGFNGIWIPIIN